MYVATKAHPNICARPFSQPVLSKYNLSSGFTVLQTIQGLVVLIKLGILLRGS